MKYNCAILVNNQYCVDDLLTEDVHCTNEFSTVRVALSCYHTCAYCVCMCTYRMLELLLTTVSSLA